MPLDEACCVLASERAHDRELLGGRRLLLPGGNGGLERVGQRWREIALMG